MTSTVYDFANLSVQLYTHANGIAQQFNDWTLLASTQSSDFNPTDFQAGLDDVDYDGYVGAAYYNQVTHEVVVVHLGTEDIIDIDDDIQLYLGVLPDQFDYAQAFNFYLQQNIAELSGQQIPTLNFQDIQQTG